MTTNRAERQPDQNIENKLAYLRTTLNDMRQAAQTFDASDVKTYRLQNLTGNYDITLSNVTTTAPQCVEYTLTPSSAVSNPVIAFDVGFQFNAPGTSGGTLFFRYDSLPPVAGVQKFRLYVMASTATLPTLNVGASFWTISNGTFTAAQVTP